MKIGICFPNYDYNILTLVDLKKYLEMFIDNGITSFDFYTSFFEKPDEKLDNLIDYLNNKDIKITLHYNGAETLVNYKNTLIHLNNYLLSKYIDYKIPIVFHIPSYQDNKYEHINNMLNTFNELSNYAKKLNFDILIETLSYNHPVGNYIGDDNSEISLFINSIKHDNFGVCWDIGHTRLNNLEHRSNLLLDNKLLTKVKHTHIHNIFKGDCYIDHLPLTNIELQDDELRYLIKNNYKGVYSIEFEVKHLKENIYIYLDSIKKLKKFIEEEYCEFRKNS